MVSKKEKEIIDALADLDPEMAAMLSVQQRIANDPTRMPNIFNPGQVLQGIQDYTGRQSTSGIISDARNMTPEEFQRQFGISNIYTRALADAQDAARRGEARAMPDSEARSESERQSIESLQAQIAENVANQRRIREAEEARQAAEFERLKNLISPGPGAGRAAAEGADYTQPLPEGTGWWDETAAKVTQREAREINQKFGTYFKSAGLPPITSLDEFLNLVRQERAQNPGEERGIFGVIYGDQFPLDNWGIFGDPQTTDPRLASNIPFGQDPSTLYYDPNDPQVMGAASPLLLPAIAALLAGYSGGQAFGSEYGFPISFPEKSIPSRDWRDITPIHPPTPGDTMLPTDAGPDAGPSDDFIDTPEARNKYLEMADQLWNKGTIPPEAITQLQNISFQTSAGQFGTTQTVTFTVQEQIESLQKLLQTFNANRAEIQQGDLRIATLASTELAQQLESKKSRQDKVNADRDFELKKRRLEFDIVNAQQSGRQVDQKLLFDYRQAAQSANQANRSLELQRYQTDVANPFNIAAMNLLSGPQETRDVVSAQQSGVTQSALNSALQAAQHHAGRQGIGIDDPQIQRIATQLVNQIDDPVQKAAMNAIAQGISNLSVTPTTQPTTGPSQNIFMDALQQRQGQAQTVPSLPSMPAMPGQMSSTQTFVPQGLRDIGFQVPSDAQSGQTTPFSRFFPGGMPTLGDLSNLSTMERKTAEAVGARTGSSAEDIIQQSSDITPRSISAGTQPVTQTQRLRQPYDQRSGFYSLGGRR